ISETYVIEGNVDNRVGNIDFDGNVIVKGDVKENFKIRARGKIEVAGNVNQALLEANDGIIVHGSTIGSELVTGKLSAFYKDSYFYLNKLRKLFSKMKQAVKELQRNSSFKTRDLQENGERQILQLLLDTKYQKIVKLLEELYRLSAEVDLDKTMDELRKLIHLLKCSINKKGLCKMDYITEFIELGARIDSVYNRLSRFDFDASDVVVNYLQNSRVVANGKILVEGKGVYNSKLRASSQIRVTGAQGFVRGGKIKAQDDIFIKELGSPGGSEVSVAVPQEHKIKSTKMNINTLLKIGGQKYRLQKDWHEVSAEIDKQGNLNIT
ncbi:MAG: FapA family protein, partial [Halanaerobacter sp.]